MATIKDTKAYQDAPSFIKWMMLFPMSNEDMYFNFCRMERGITKDARMFLETCATFLEEGLNLPYPHTLYLAEQLRRLATAKASPFKAPLLKRGRGKKSSDTLAANFEIARRVWDNVKNHSMTIESAAEDVSEKSQRRSSASKGGRWKQQLRPIDTEGAIAQYKKFLKILNQQDSSSPTAKAMIQSDSKIDLRGRKID